MAHQCRGTHVRDVADIEAGMTPVGRRETACPSGQDERSKDGGADAATFIYEKSPTSIDVRDSYKKVAATYSPTWWGSTIGDGEI